MPLRLVKRKGSDNWYLRGSVRGISVFETTKIDDKEAADAIRIIKEHRLLKESIFGKDSAITFDEAALEYLDSGGEARFVGKWDHETGKGTLLFGQFAGKALISITQRDLDKAARHLYPNVQWNSLNRLAYTPFIAVWNHAKMPLRKWSRPKKPKGTTVRRLKPNRAGTRPTTYERAAEFVLAMSPAPAMVMTALFYTGMRPIEMFVLDARMVSIENKWIALEHSKIGEPRGIPIHDFLVPLFVKLKERGGIMFRSHLGTPYPAGEHEGGLIKSAITGARNRSGITDISPYTARHTVSTQLVINGIHPYIKDQILGHSRDDMSRHYTNVPQEPLLKAINTLAVIPAWQAAPWMTDPLAWESKSAGKPGERTDLKKDGA